MNRTETTSAAWSARDETFFHVVAGLFAPDVLFGAGVLLASYDPEPAPRAVAGRAGTLVPA